MIYTNLLATLREQFPSIHYLDDINVAVLSNDRICHFVLFG